MPEMPEFGESFLKFMNTMNAAAPREEAFFPARLAQHFGVAADTLPIVTHKFVKYEEPNLQLALDEMLAAQPANEPGEVLGVQTENRRYEPPTLASLVSKATVGYRTATQGPVEYHTFELPGGRALSCVSCGLVLITFGGERVALMVNGPSEHGFIQAITVDVMAPTRESAERFLTSLRSRVHALSVYRGKALSVVQDQFRNTGLRFHDLPKIGRKDIILAADVLDRIERQTLSFAENARALAQAKRHLRRGILLYGPPGTGKTLTAMYLASAMEGRTVVLATGFGHGMLEYSCSIARALQPSMVVLEDVDLIAKDRERSHDGCAQPLLFELLNQMDGLAEDADIVFVLTTNRAAELESALTARPGRIDQAIEVPLPDAECRDRLITLYSNGLDIQLSDRASVIARTQGASAAFIKELLRRAALLACVEGGAASVRDRHIDEALRELVISGGLMTGRLLGFDPEGTRKG